MRRLLLVLIVLLLAPGVAHAGGGDIDMSACAGYSEGDEIAMQDSCYSGTAHFTPAETTVTVTNVGTLPHTLTAVDGSFDSGNLMPGESTEMAFSEPGVYRFFCGLHGTMAGEGMAGVLLVGDAVPAPMSTSVDLSSVEETVAVESEAIRRSLFGQGRVIGEIKSVQADMALALEKLASADESTGPSAIVAEQGGGRSPGLIVLGLAIGLGVALAVTSRRRPQPVPAAGSDHLDSTPGAAGQ